MDEDLEAMTREQLITEVRRLRAGIRAHRDSTGHALCWHHPALWGLLPEMTDPLSTVPTWPEFLRGCVRYRQSLAMREYVAKNDKLQARCEAGRLTSRPDALAVWRHKRRNRRGRTRPEDQGPAGSGDRGWWTASRWGCQGMAESRLAQLVVIGNASVQGVLPPELGAPDQPRGQTVGIPLDSPIRRW